MKRLLLAVACLAYLGGFSQETGIRQSSTAHVVIRCGLASNYHEPLYIVDGVPVDSAFVKQLDVNKIERIDILKSSNASAIYGSPARAGVVIITTRRSFVVIVEDQENNRIPYASVSISWSNDSTRSASGRTDTNGVAMFQREHAKRLSRLVVSSIGYENVDIKPMNDSRDTIKVMLKNKIVELSACVFTSKITAIKRRLIACGLVTCRVSADKHQDAAIVPSPVFGTARVFPNPVPQHGTVYLQPGHGFEEQGMIRLISMTGQVVYSQRYVNVKGTQTIPIKVGPGSYVVELISANNRAPQKISQILIVR